MADSVKELVVAAITRGRVDYCTHVANTLVISFTSAYSTMHHGLEYHKIHARLIPKWLTEKHKWTRVEASTQYGSSHY
jgi:hypothetical protein